MKVKYHVLQRDDETGKTRHKFLCTRETDLAMVGKQISLDNIKYRVEGLEWIDRDIGVLKAVCLEIPAIKD